MRPLSPVPFFPSFLTQYLRFQHRICLSSQEALNLLFYPAPSPVDAADLWTTVGTAKLHLIASFHESEVEGLDSFFCATWKSIVVVVIHIVVVVHGPQPCHGEGACVTQ